MGRLISLDKERAKRRCWSQNPAVDYTCLPHIIGLIDGDVQPLSMTAMDKLKMMILTRVECDYRNDDKDDQR